MLQVLLLLGLTLELIVYALLTLYWRRHGMDGILITLFVRACSACVTAIRSP